MKAWASLHTSEPTSQSSNEAVYAGYWRVEIEWNPNFGREAITVAFPEIKETLNGEITHICVGVNESGDGEILQSVAILPYIQMQQGFNPRVAFINLPEPLPETLNPIAAVVWNLVNDRVLDPSTLHPKLFEAVNDAFHEAGLPIMKVVREGAATMNIKLSQMPSLSSFGNTVGNA